MIIPTSRQTALGNNRALNDRTGAALESRAATINKNKKARIKKELQNVSGTPQSGYRDAGGDEHQRRRAVRSGHALCERTLRPRRSGGRAQVVQPGRA